MASFDAGAAMAVQAAAEAAAMEQLRVERLHLPAVPAATRAPDQYQTATQGLIALGKELDQPAGTGVEQLLSAARQHLQSSEPDRLPFKQLDLLLADYKALARARAAVQLRQQLLKFAQQQQEQDQQQEQQEQEQQQHGFLGAAVDVQLRFVNASKESLKVRDVAALHQEYCQLLAAAQQA